MSKRVYDIPITVEYPMKHPVTPFEQTHKSSIQTSRSFGPITSNKNQTKRQEREINDEEEETPYAQGYDNLVKNDGIGKFRFVIPFNHSPSSAFTLSSKSTVKSIHSPIDSSSSTLSSYSTVRNTSMNNSNLSNNTNSNPRSTLMTAV